MSERWDVIIVGAGPAGSALSIQLARAAVQVLLVDRAQFPRDKLCGEFLSPECWPVLDCLGVGDSIRSSGYQPISGLRLWIPGGRCVQAALPQRANCPAVGLSRARLDQLLSRRAADLGVTIAENLQVVGLVERAGTVLGVRTRPASRSAPAGGSQDLFAKVIIAADGRGSLLVRESGKIRVLRRSTPDEVCAVKRHYRVAGRLDPGGDIELHSFPGGYAGVCRVESGKVNLCTLVPRSLVRQARGNLERALRSAFQGSRLHRWLGQSEPLGSWKTVADVRLERSQPQLAGMLYVGDAMGTIDPLGGEGMTMALEGALLAASFVEQAVASRNGCDHPLQRRYQSAWLDRFGQRIRLCRSFSWLLARPGLLGAFLSPFLPGAWSQALLPLAFRATRGRPGLVSFWEVPHQSAVVL